MPENNWVMYKDSIKLFLSEKLIHYLVEPHEIEEIYEKSYLLISHIMNLGKFNPSESENGTLREYELEDLDGKKITYRRSQKADLRIKKNNNKESISIDDEVLCNRTTTNDQIPPEDHSFSSDEDELNQVRPDLA